MMPARIQKKRQSLWGQQRLIMRDLGCYGTR